MSNTKYGLDRLSMRLSMLPLKNSVKLTLIRHGESTWNASPSKFTGWCDPPLTAGGIEEAKETGKLLQGRGFNQIDKVYTSALNRALETTELILEGCSPISDITEAWQLNERHYGALQGYYKDDAILAEKYGGADVIKKVRREYSAVPPPMDERHPYYLPPPAPLSESLAMCQERVIKYWEESIVTTLRPKDVILIVAHSNTIRAIVAYLDDVEETQIPKIHIPNCVPCVYPVSILSGMPVYHRTTHSNALYGDTHGTWIFSEENFERLQKNIGGTGSFLKSIFEGWDLDKNGQLTMQEFNSGFSELMGENNITRSIVGCMFREVDQDYSQTISLAEFQNHFTRVCRKFVPDLLDD